MNQKIQERLIKGLAIACLGVFSALIIVIVFFSMVVSDLKKEMMADRKDCDEAVKLVLHYHEELDSTRMIEMVGYLKGHLKKMPKVETYKNKSGGVRYKVNTDGLNAVDKAIALGIASLPYIEEHYGRIITAASKKYGVPEPWIYAFIAIESQGAWNALSICTAIGLMQIRPTTCMDMGFDPDELARPEVNIPCGVKYIAFLQKYSAEKNTDIGMAFEWVWVTSYNAGPKKTKLKYAKQHKWDEGGMFHPKVSGVYNFIVERQKLKIIANETEVAVEDKMF